MWEIFDMPISCPVWDVHNRHMDCISFRVKEVVRPSPRKGDLNKKILQKEARWIHRLKSVEPLGLNEQLSFSCFI